MVATPGGGDTLEILFWNGGRRMAGRLRSNPVLKSILKCMPDIFVYVETLSSGNTSSLIRGYDTITHTLKPNTVRRGIAVFYKTKFRHALTKDQTSEKFDILWLRLQTSSEEVILCLFYAPHEQHDKQREFLFTTN